MTWDGVLAGLVGYAIVAILVGVIDVVLGRSFFFTAATLGQSMFYGLSDPAQVVIAPGPVFAYNGVHFLGCVAIGVCGAWLAYMAEQGHELWYVGVVLFMAVVVASFGAVLLFSRGLQAVVPLWMIVVPTLVAVTAIVVVLLLVRPGLRRELTTWRD